MLRKPILPGLLLLAWLLGVQTTQADVLHNRNNSKPGAQQQASTASTIAELKRRGLYTSLQQAMQAALYRVEPEHGHTGRYAADNLAQHYSAQFEAAGIQVRIGSHQPGRHDLSMCLSEVVQDGHPLAFAPAHLRAKDDRMEYDRGNVQEWYKNTPKGLEQGFTILHKSLTEKPGKLEVRLAVRGGLQGHLSQDGQWIDFGGSAGHSGLRYGKLQARDAGGRVLGSHLRLAGSEIGLEVDTQQAVYPVRIDPLIVGSGPVLTTSDGAPNDELGSAVSISGNMALIGARGKAYYTGAAYIFVRHGYVWSQQAELTASDGTQFDEFGWTVSLSGNTALIGSPFHASNTGAAYVFTNSGGVWSQQQELTASDAAKNDLFGNAVSVSGNVAIIGSPFHASNTGAAYMFTNSGGVWSQQQKLTASDGVQEGEFGHSVCLSGNTALIGAPVKASFTGAAYVFTNSGGVWSQQQELTASDGVQGDSFGWSVSLSGNTALIGALGKASYTGAAYVFVQDGGSWTQQQELTASDGAAGDVFGASVSISGNTALVGVPQKTFGAATNTGAAYMFTNSGGVWSQQQELTASDSASGDDFGNAVCVSGNIEMVGAPDQNASSGVVYAYPLGHELNASDGAQGDDFGYAVSLSGNTALIGALGKASYTGEAYVFVQNGGTWTQQQKLTASDAAHGDGFGYVVSLSGNTALVGAPFHAHSGAVYVFTNSGGTWSQQQKLTASDAAQNDFFGWSVSLSGNTALIGAPNKTGFIGAAYVFTSNGGSWTQQKELTASNGAQNDSFGWSVSLSGNTALIGAIGRASQTGAAYVFTGSSGVWSQQAELTASDGMAGDSFGQSVSISGNIALIGAYGKSTNTGAAYIFVSSGSIWTQQAELSASDAAQGDQFGYAVSISGNTVLIGAPNRSSFTGTAYVFVGNSRTWSQQQEWTANDGTQFDEFGYAVSLSGNTALIGAPFHNNNTGAVYTLGQSPIAQNDSYTAYVNTSLSVANAEGVLYNDADPSALSLSAVLVVPPANGSLTLNPDGSFVHTPDAGFSGTDTFAYQATNGFDASDLTWVTITVISPIPPVISDLDPTEAAAGVTSLYLLVNGMDFTTGSVVSVNNTPVATFLVSDMQLLALVPSSFLSTPTTLSVQVNNPQPNGASNSVDLPVVNFLDSVSTGTFVIGGSPATLTIRLNTPAPLSRLTLALSSNQPGVVQFVDSSNNPISQITFTTGQQTVQVKVVTTAVSQQTSVQLQASVGGTSKSATLLVLPQQQTGVGIVHKPGVGPPLHSPALPK